MCGEVAVALLFEELEGPVVNGGLHLAGHGTAPQLRCKQLHNPLDKVAVIVLKHDFCQQHRRRLGEALSTKRPLSVMLPHVVRRLVGQRAEDLHRVVEPVEGDGHQHQAGDVLPGLKQLHRVDPLTGVGYQQKADPLLLQVANQEDLGDHVQKGQRILQHDDGDVVDHGPGLRVVGQLPLHPHDVLHQMAPVLHKALEILGPVVKEPYLLLVWLAEALLQVEPDLIQKSLHPRQHQVDELVQHRRPAHPQQGLGQL